MKGDVTSDRTQMFITEDVYLLRPLITSCLEIIYTHLRQNVYSIVSKVVSYMKYYSAKRFF